MQLSGASNASLAYFHHENRQLKMQRHPPRLNHKHEMATESLNRKLLAGKRKKKSNRIRMTLSPFLCASVQFKEQSLLLSTTQLSHLFRRRGRSKIIVERESN